MAKILLYLSIGKLFKGCTLKINNFCSVNSGCLATKVLSYDRVATLAGMAGKAGKAGKEYHFGPRVYPRGSLVIALVRGPSVGRLVCL